jgi:HPr kinase/phosphorylase
MMCFGPSRKKTRSSDERRAVKARAHGALVDVLNVGVLLLGPSGIGKSECALELIQRGNRLVADDVVLLRRGKDGRLYGSAPELIRHYVEVRGLGIVYLPDLFGPESVREECEVGLICRLEAWRDGMEYERVGLERPTETWLEVVIPSLLLPARPAGSMATLVEVAVREHLQRNRGASAVSRLDARLQAQVTRR